MIFVLFGVHNKAKYQNPAASNRTDRHHPAVSFLFSSGYEFLMCNLHLIITFVSSA